MAIIDPSIFTPPYDQALAEALVDDGLEVHWLGRRPRSDDAVTAGRIQPEPLFYGLTENMRPYVPEAMLLPIKAAEHAWQLLGLNRYLVANGYSIAHFQWTPVPVIDQCVIRQIRKNMPVILTVHDTEVFHGDASHSLQRRGWGRVLASADQVIVHVASAAEKLVSNGIDRQRIHVIPHPAFSGPDENELRRAREDFPLDDLGFSRQRVNFLLFGRLAPYKGLDPLLDAVAGMTPEQRSGIRIVLAGKPAFDVPRYRSSIEQFGLGECLKVIPRFLSHEELIAYLGNADVLLFPYLDIDASGALMQALPFGPAVIASNIGIFADVLTHEKNALMIDPNDSEQLRQAIVTLADDPGLRASIRAEVLGLLEHDLSWAHAAAETRRVYERALGR